MIHSFLPFINKWLRQFLGTVLSVPDNIQVVIWDIQFAERNYIFHQDPAQDSNPNCPVTMLSVCVDEILEFYIIPGSWDFLFNP